MSTPHHHHHHTARVSAFARLRRPWQTRQNNSLLLGLFRFVFKFQGGLRDGKVHPRNPRGPGVQGHAPASASHVVSPAVVRILVLPLLEGEPNVVVVEGAQRVAVVVHLSLVRCR